MSRFSSKAVAYEPTPETKAKLDTFEVADRLFKETWGDFEREHQARLESIDRLREARNVALDHAKKALRAEAFELNYEEVKAIETGKFTVQKKFSRWYMPEAFVQIVDELGGQGMHQKAVEAGAIQEKVEVDFEKATDWLTKNSLLERFESCKDGREQTPAVSGPKPISAFGAEVKTE